MIRSVIAALTAGLLLAANPATAAGLGFLAKGPMTKFNDADMKFFDEAMAEAFAAKKPGVPFEWKNEQTGASGSITPRRIFTRKGQPCSELQIVNRHKALEEKGVYRFCQQDGRWTLAR